MSEAWRRCSACKESIELGAVYWACNVSTCNRKRTALAFCSVDCWEVHLPGANHREAWAVEKKAPTRGESETPARTKRAPARPTRRRVVADPPSAAAGGPTDDADDVLVIASRLKAYIKKHSGYNTSDRVLAPLSNVLREVCDRAIENARREGRMTVLDRDLPNRD